MLNQAVRRARLSPHDNEPLDLLRAMHYAMGLAAADPAFQQHSETSASPIPGLSRALEAAARAISQRKGLADPTAEIGGIRRQVDQFVDKVEHVGRRAGVSGRDLEEARTSRDHLFALGDQIIEKSLVTAAPQQEARRSLEENHPAEADASPPPSFAALETATSDNED